VRAATPAVTGASQRGLCSNRKGDTTVSGKAHFVWPSLEKPEMGGRKDRSTVARWCDGCYLPVLP